LHAGDISRSTGRAVPVIATSTTLSPRYIIKHILTLCLHEIQMNYNVKYII
jgi:hypothetical protein